jgi:hypothetical protein
MVARIHCGGEQGARKGMGSDRPKPATEDKVVKASTSWSSLRLRRRLAVSKKTSHAAQVAIS